MVELTKFTLGKAAAKCTPLAVVVAVRPLLPGSGGKLA